MPTEHEQHMANSNYALVRVILLFPVLTIAGASLGKWIEGRYGSGNNMLFVASLIIAAGIGWLYIIYEYRRIKKIWKKKDHEQSS